MSPCKIGSLLQNWGDGWVLMASGTALEEADWGGLVM